eukprot:6175073-Pleurochrysis_carterae.AAC.1
MREAETRPAREAERRARAALLRKERESIVQPQPRPIFRPPPQTVAVAPQPGNTCLSITPRFRKGGTSPIESVLALFSDKVNGQFFEPRLAPTGNGRAGPASRATEAFNCLKADAEQVYTDKAGAEGRAHGARGDSYQPTKVGVRCGDSQDRGERDHRPGQRSLDAGCRCVPRTGVYDARAFGGGGETFLCELADAPGSGWSHGVGGAVSRGVKQAAEDRAVAQVRRGPMQAACSRHGAPWPQTADGPASVQRL